MTAMEELMHTLQPVRRLSDTFTWANSSRAARKEHMTDDHGHHKKITIIVNGRKKEVEAKELSYTDVINLAYDNNPPSGENIVITVTYKKGEGDKQGTLLPGDTVKIKEGMIFNVTATDKS